ncbi:hypothetical protein [Streptomyces sp. V1I6]|uniref:hypothetical protein n=1 Tax=Streptomyces sp. V1I6 TaxID=3042273 RepID=UPI0027803C78|nr:hypothetical protein [Streptomyces sp. V1I6]MDQ0842440.1 hypothetical protein [Streptomyces sp. V1I6]
MTQLERLLAEAVPDGTFGGARTPQPRRGRPQPARPLWTPEQQAAHYVELAAVLDGWEWDEEHRNEERRRLRLITSDTAA